jgi:cyclophilin family peptidyl-prolyl cis-trans isomerase
MSVRRRPEPTPAPDIETIDVPDSWRRRPWLPYLIMGVLVAVVLGSGLAVQQALKAPGPSALANCRTSTATGPHVFIAPQPVCILPNHKYTATMNTSQGQIVIELLPDSAPVTVNNFVVLAQNGYYDNLTFWKSEDWVIQGGDPNGDGRGGPGYLLPDEPSSFLQWDLGAVGMARVPGGAVNGSQFFIQKAAWPGSGPTATYNRFGTVVSGMDKAQLITTFDKIYSVTISVT